MSKCYCFVLIFRMKRVLIIIIIIVIISFIHVSPLNLDPSLSQVYVNILGEYGVKMYRLEEICHQASSVLNNCP